MTGQMKIERGENAAGTASMHNGKSLLDVQLSLDPSKLFLYKLMIQNRFRKDGPTKSMVVLTSKKQHPSPVTAEIDPDTWDAKFVVREGFEFKQSPELLRYLERQNITEPLRVVLENAAYHEMGHWEFPRGGKFGCPYDKPTYYASFIEPIFEELSKNGKFGEDLCKIMATRIANAVSDVIDNFNVQRQLTQRGKKYSGLPLFWYLQGQENGKYSEEYTLFVKLNLAVSGTKPDYKLLERFMVENPELGKAVSRLKAIFTEERIYTKENWEILAREYTKELLKFIKEEKPRHQYSPGDPTACPKGNPIPSPKKDGEEQDGDPGKEKGESLGKGKETSEKPDKDPETGGVGSGEEQEEPGEGEPFTKDDVPELGEDLKPGEIEEIISGRKAGQGIPFYIKTEKALDAYYRSLAKKIPIEAGGDLPTAELPLISLVREPYDEDTHSLEDISPGKLYVDPIRRIIIPSVTKTKISVDVPLIREKRNLPECVFALIDSSGSMMMGEGDKTIIPWGDQSYYHFGILTYFGLLRYFEMERILHRMKFSAAIFSDVTLGARNLQNVKNLLFNPATGGTRLDLRKVMEYMGGRKNVLFSMISDGEIINWSSIKSEFIQLAQRNQFFMIQIGGKSQTCIDLERAGLPVYYVESAADITKLAIDLTAKRYRAAIASGLKDEGEKYKNLAR
jgi:hypothetical protein